MRSFTNRWRLQTPKDVHRRPSPVTLPAARVSVPASTGNCHSVRRHFTRHRTRENGERPVRTGAEPAVAVNCRLWPAVARILESCSTRRRTRASRQLPATAGAERSPLCRLWFQFLQILTKLCVLSLPVLTEMDFAMTIWANGGDPARMVRSAI